MSITPISPISRISPVFASSATSAASAGADFASKVTQSLDQVQSAQNKADDLAVQAATGRLTDVHDYMIASTEATLATRLTVAVRNKGLEAFNEIMRMQA